MTKTSIPETNTTAPAATLDMADFFDTTRACNAGTEIELLHPVTEAPTGFHISIMGRHSDAYREYLREDADTNMRLSQQRAQRGAKPELPSVSQSEKKAVELLAAMTTGFRCSVPGSEGDYFAFRGERLTFNHRNAIRLYTELLPVRQQVDAAIGNIALFMPA